MKYIFIALSLLPCFAFGQKSLVDAVTDAATEWSFNYEGNPIDGKRREARRINNEFLAGDEMFVLNISAKGENRENNALIGISTSTPLFESLKTVLIYFDNDDSYYDVKYVLSESGNLILITEMTNNTSKIQSNYIDIIKMLKTKSNAYFRFIFNSRNDINISYSLDGSSLAIDKVLDITDISKSRIETDLIEINQESKADKKPMIFSEIDFPPRFQGCEELNDKIEIVSCFHLMIQEHIKDYFKYPKVAEEMGIQGQVLTMFTINEGGYVQEILTRAPDNLLENEAKRILSLIPKMIPAKHNGKSVKVNYSIPINFKLN